MCRFRLTLTITVYEVAPVHLRTLVYAVRIRLVWPHPDRYDDGAVLTVACHGLALVLAGFQEIKYQSLHSRG